MDQFLSGELWLDPSTMWMNRRVLTNSPADSNLHIQSYTNKGYPRKTELSWDLKKRSDLKKAPSDDCAPR